MILVVIKFAYQYKVAYGNVIVMVIEHFAQLLRNINYRFMTAIAIITLGNIAVMINNTVFIKGTMILNISMEMEVITKCPK